MFFHDNSGLKKAIKHDKRQTKKQDTNKKLMNLLATVVKATSQFIDQINSSIGRAVSWLVVIMVFVTFGVVVMRYLFNTGSIQAQESIIYMHAVVFMLAAASTLKQDGHVRVDIFYGKMSVKKKALVNLLGNLFLLIPVSAFILWSSWDYVLESWDIRETSREAGGLPWIYLLKSVIIIFTSMLILQGIAEILKSLIALFSRQQSTSSSESNSSVTD